MERSKGQSLGDYVVLRQLEKVGHARLYEVEHGLTRRREAIKVLTPESAHSPNDSDRFLREIRLHANLDHPNIAAVHNAFWDDDSLLLVGELVQGESLDRLLERGRLPLARSLDLIRQVLCALTHAHARGVIHRDIAPANIYVTAEASVKLTNFGLAKSPADPSMSYAGSPLGSLRYSSPEQIRGLKTLDARTDIYSCGAVLYEMVTGRKAAEGDNECSIMMAHGEQPVRPPRSIDPTVPKRLEDIILKALAKNPDARFQSADGFLLAIQEIQLRSGTASKSRSAIWAAGGMAVGLASMLGATYLFTPKPLTQVTLHIPAPPPPAESQPDLQRTLDAKAGPATSTPMVQARSSATRPPALSPPPQLALGAPPAGEPSAMEPNEAAEPDKSSPAGATQDEARSRASKVFGALKRVNPFYPRRPSE